ncbi:hypothetical protein HZ326_9159 [Fusarium oxysporum f. sp. albedinis]|nr:hypothetical protein HZ326_9159 [Fusarium oxysporum f. sp. albedinis]
MRTHFTSFARPHVTGVPRFMGYPHCASSEFSSPSLLEGGQCLASVIAGLCVRRHLCITIQAFEAETPSLLESTGLTYSLYFENILTRTWSSGPSEA